MKKKILGLLMILTLGMTFVFISGPVVKANTLKYYINFSGSEDRIDYTYEIGSAGEVWTITHSYSSHLTWEAQIDATGPGDMYQEWVHGMEFGIGNGNVTFNNPQEQVSYTYPIGPSGEQWYVYSGGVGEMTWQSNSGLIPNLTIRNIQPHEPLIITITMSNEDNTRPAISGQENFVTNVDDAKPVSFFQQYITAIDETDGAVPVYVITDNYTANISRLGEHKVIFGAKDSSNNEATLEVYIRVVDITKPVISGNSSVANIGYKETWNISNFKTTLTVSDNYDTLTHNDITVKSDSYTSNKTKLGTYNVVYAVVDNSGNEGTFTKQVKVIDNVKPNISGPTTIATSNNTILTESDVRSQLTASDEIDGNITSKIELVEDNYTGQGNKVGTYTIKYRVVDNAGNVGEHTVTIQRSDKIPPVFFIEDGVTIKTTPTTPLTFEQIIEILDATNQVTINAQTTFRTLFNDYTGFEDEPGLYTWSVEAKSTNGSESVHHMSIQVLDVEDEDTVDVTPDFDLVEWIQDNIVWLIVGGVVLVGGAYLISKRK